MKLRIFLLFLFLSLFRAQADVIDSLMTHPRDSIALTSDSLVLRFLSESGIPISDNNKVRLLKSGREKFIDLFSAIRDAKPAKRPLLLCMENSAKISALVREGEVACAVSADHAEQGRLALRLLFEHLVYERTPEENEICTPTVVTIAENA